ncbi:hypothetical protein H7F51_05560 [Novosphingobium flavum]|uniref:Uncharacterized protein n=1 Tax=Novosphingobium flavum TaxID=1778672 RepID=A0A7X1FQI1_9SPHN|nr:hypothetical protein [Novosphingobium flavum]
MATIHRDPSRNSWGRGTWARLLGQILALADNRGELLRHAERAWASATFAGTRHTIALTFTGDEALAAGERLIDALPEHEFDISGHLVADAMVCAVEHSLLPEPVLTVELEVLLLEDL